MSISDKKAHAARLLSARLLSARLLSGIRVKAPLVHNITNYVVMNSSANILLAMGASPVMAHCLAEVEEMTGIANALVLNIGTLDESWLEAMLLAGKTANQKGIPVILDPVGAGATAFRTAAVKRIMEECAVSVLRGNASEVFSLVDSTAKTKGVDASLILGDDHIEMAREMAKHTGCVVAISGAVDCITDGEKTCFVKNGNVLMTRVTGVGCGLSAAVAAFCAAADDGSDGGDLFDAVVSAFGFYGICGEMAARIADKPGGFAVAFIDSLYAAGDDDIHGSLDISPY